MKTKIDNQIIFNALSLLPIIRTCSTDTSEIASPSTIACILDFAWKIYRF
jgi:hypothetical protein